MVKLIIAANAVSLAFVALSAFMVHKDHHLWWLPFIGAGIFAQSIKGKFAPPEEKEKP